MNTEIKVSKGSGAAGRSLGFMKKLLIDHNYILSLLLLLIGQFASDQFLSSASLINLLKSSVFIGIIALGMTLVIISGNIDL